jgi:hypothetical protein
MKQVKQWSARRAAKQGTVREYTPCNMKEVKDKRFRKTLRVIKNKK